MSEAELVEAGANYNGLLQGWLSAYFTAFTAYILTAYFVGNRLTSTQTLFISGGFVIYSLICAFSVYGTGSQVVEFGDAVEAINPERQILANYPTLYVGVMLLLTGILVSLKFMWDVRRQAV